MEILTLNAQTTYIDRNGYRRYTHNSKLVHREVAEKMLGRRLRPGEVVHHKDRDKLNNDPSNLWVFPSQKEHDRIHRRDARRHGREASYRGFRKDEPKDVNVAKEEGTLCGNKIKSLFKFLKRITWWLGWIFLAIGVFIYFKPFSDGFVPRKRYSTEKLRRSDWTRNKRVHRIGKHSTKRY
jgi:HNH endonuclease